MKLLRQLRSAQASLCSDGFTIVELMIATLVFSTILLVITFGVIHFSSDYYKGINSSTTQDTARQVIDSVAQAVQFSGSTPMAPNANSYCIGNQQLVYDLGHEVQSSTDSGLSQITNTTCNTAAVTSDGTELLDKRMRLVQFKVSEPVNPDGTPMFSDHNVWNITVSIAFGDNDLLCDTSQSSAAAGGCGKTAAAIADGDTATAASHGNLRCRLAEGSQFCDVVTLSTTVTRRIVGTS